MTSSELQSASIAILPPGPGWQTKIAHRLGVSPRTVRRWIKADKTPSWVDASFYLHEVIDQAPEKPNKYSVSAKISWLTILNLRIILAEDAGDRETALKWRRIKDEWLRSPEHFKFRMDAFASKFAKREVKR